MALVATAPASTGNTVFKADTADFDAAVVAQAVAEVVDANARLAGGHALIKLISDVPHRERPEVWRQAFFPQVPPTKFYTGGFRKLVDGTVVRAVSDGGLALITAQMLLMQHPQWVGNVQHFEDVVVDEKTGARGTVVVYRDENGAEAKTAPGASQVALLELKANFSNLPPTYTVDAKYQDADKPRSLEIALCAPADTAPPRKHCTDNWHATRIGVVSVENIIETRVKPNRRAAAYGTHLIGDSSKNMCCVYGPVRVSKPTDAFADTMEQRRWADCMRDGINYLPSGMEASITIGAKVLPAVRAPGNPKTDAEVKAMLDEIKEKEPSFYEVLKDRGVLKHSDLPFCDYRSVRARLTLYDPSQSSDVDVLNNDELAQLTKGYTRAWAIVEFATPARYPESKDPNSKSKPSAKFRMRKTSVVAEKRVPRDEHAGAVDLESHGPASTLFVVEGNATLPEDARKRAYGAAMAMLGYAAAPVTPAKRRALTASDGSKRAKREPAAIKDTEEDIDPDDMPEVGVTPTKRAKRAAVSDANEEDIDPDDKPEDEEDDDEDAMSNMTTEAEDEDEDTA